MKIGVALSSGGASGMAHVGVLEELASAGIPVHCVAGTSAGALVGAAWAADHLDGFHETMCGLTRRGVFGLFDPTWPRTGLLEGRRPLDLIRPWIGETFETLPHPFAAVATELQSGREIVLRKGVVADAIRASSAVPGLLMPWKVGERVLFDGGLVNPIPVDVARDLGGGFIIAVSVLGIEDEDEPEEKTNAHGLAAQWLARLFPNGKAAGQVDAKPAAEHLPPEIDDLGLLEIIARSARIVQMRLAEERLRVHAPDALIRVSLPDFSLFELYRSAEAIEAGRNAAREAMPSIKASLEEATSIPGRVTRWLKPGIS